MNYIRRQKKIQKYNYDKPSPGWSICQQKLHKIIQIQLFNSNTTDPIPGDFVKLVEKDLLELDITMKM